MRTTGFILLLLVSYFPLNTFAAQVTGIIDNVYNNSYVRGWACVTTRTASIPIHIYVGGPAGKGQFLASYMAIAASEKAVDNACQHPGVSGRHRFNYTFTEAQKRQHHGKKIYIHGIGSGVSNRLLGRSGNFVVPNPKPQPQPQSLGIIDGIPDLSDEKEAIKNINGWACIKGNTSSVIVDIYANKRLIHSVQTEKPSGLAVARECEHVGQTGNHRFSVTLTNEEKTLYNGQKIYAKVRETSSSLVNSGRFSIPSEVGYKFTVTNSPDDFVEFIWDLSNTEHCSNINGTAISFPGGQGTTHGNSNSQVEKMERVLGQKCVRLIRAHVNPGTSGGYWQHNDSFRNASALMTSIIKQGKSNEKDVTGKYLLQGKVIVVGSSAGSMIAASALEYQNAYRSLVGRTIMVSGPLGADVSYQCAVIRSEDIKQWLDDIFNTGNACLTCADSNDCHTSIGSSKDVVNISNKSFRSYLHTNHEIAILVGDSDILGCDDGTGYCGYWNPVGVVRQYVRSIAANDAYYFEKSGSDGVSTTYNPNKLRIINGGTHDLWDNVSARQLICRNIMEEVNPKEQKVCNAL